MNLTINKCNNNNTLLYSTKVGTLHSHSRVGRLELSKRLIEEENAYIMGEFEVDRGHRNGAEVHRVYSNGVIEIFNRDSKRFVTLLIGTPNQVKRYFTLTRTPITEEVEGAMGLARVHKRLKYNEVN